MKTMISESTRGVDKTARYGWITKDEPGELKLIHKSVLRINHEYQRGVATEKVTEITAQWSFVACGAIVVASRNHEYWVIDGQHRVLAAMRRSDISHLPCVVFETLDVRQEATAFLDLNTGRKPVTAIDKFKALSVSGNKAAGFVRATLTDLGIAVTRTAKKEKEMKCLAWALRRANENQDRFLKVVSVAAEISVGIAIQEKLLDGLWYIDERIDGGITGNRFYARIRQIGGQNLIEAATRASAYFARGGAAIWAQGMMDAINHGLRIRFSFEEKP